MKKIVLIATTLVASISTPSLYAACSAEIDMGNQKIINLGDAAVSSDDAVSLGKLTDTVNGYIGSGNLVVGTVADIEGNVYTTKKIGDRVWTTQSMRTTKYPDGSAITHANENSWSGNNSDDYYTFGNSVSSNNTCPNPASGVCTSEETSTFKYSQQDDQTTPGAVEQYGLLYQWNAAMNGSTTEGAQGICMDGWHVATDDDWKNLEVVVATANGTNAFDDSCLDSTGRRYGASGDGSACAVSNDMVGGSLQTRYFNSTDGASSGIRFGSGTFFRDSLGGYFWTSTVSGSSPFYRVIPKKNYTNKWIDRALGEKITYLSVRCVQN